MKNIMTTKWVAWGVLTCFLLASMVPNASAKEGDVTVEGFAGIGVGPDDPDFDFGSTFSGGIGFGYEIKDNIQIRADVSFFKWEDMIKDIPFLGPLTVDMDLEIRNVPVFVGARYFIPIASNARLFGELGLSMNFLKATMDFDFSAMGETFSISESDTKLGVVPGLGIEYMVTPKVGLGAGARYHIISKGVGDFEGGKTSFFSAVGLINYHL